METSKFYIGRSIKEGWNFLKEHFGMYLVFALIMAIGFIISAILIGGQQGQIMLEAGSVQSIDPLYFWVPLLNFLISAFALLFVINGVIGFFSSSNEEINFEEIIPSFSEFLYYLGVVILSGLALFVIYIGTFIVSLLLFGGLGPIAFIFILVGVVAGTFLSVKWMFAPYSVMDKEKGPIEALKYSFNITDNHFWRLLGLMISLGIIVAVAGTILGAVGGALGGEVISAVVTGLVSPFPVVVFGYAYNKLSS